MTDADGLDPITEATACSAGRLAERLDARLIIVASASGRTALRLSKNRNFVPTVGVSDSEATLRRMCLYWGVIPLGRRADRGPGRTGAFRRRSGPPGRPPGLRRPRRPRGRHRPERHPAQHDRRPPDSVDGGWHVPDCSEGRGSPHCHALRCRSGTCHPS